MHSFSRARWALLALVVPFAVATASQLPVQQRYDRVLAKVEVGPQLRNGKPLTGYRAVLTLDQPVPNADVLMLFVVNGVRQLIYSETAQVLAPRSLAEWDSGVERPETEAGDDRSHFTLQWHPYVRGFSGADLEDGTAVTFLAYAYTSTAVSVRYEKGERPGNGRYRVTLADTYPSAPYFNVALDCAGRKVAARANGGSSRHAFERGAPGDLLSFSEVDLKRLGCADPVAALQGKPLRFFLSGGDFFLLDHWFSH